MRCSAAMSAPRRSRMFASLEERNVRIFFVGLGISNIGTWAQTTGVVLLVTRLGGEGLEIGLAVASQFFFSGLAKVRGIAPGPLLGWFDGSLLYGALFKQAGCASAPLRTR